MQQKVQFAAAVIHQPDPIVLDEPFTGLDPINSRLLQDLILEQRERGATVILSTHRMEQVEALCESICLIHEGRPVLDGVLADIRAGYGRNTVVVEYEGGARLIEVILGAVTSTEFMAGKILGVLGSGLTQLGIWVAAVLLGVFYAAPMLSLGAGVAEFDLGAILSLELIFYFSVFFTLGYFLYSVFFGCGSSS